MLVKPRVKLEWLLSSVLLQVELVVGAYICALLKSGNLLLAQIGQIEVRALVASASILPLACDLSRKQYGRYQSYLRLLSIVRAKVSTFILVIAREVYLTHYLLSLKLFASQWLLSLAECLHLDYAQRQGAVLVVIGADIR